MTGEVGGLDETASRNFESFKPGVPAVPAVPHKDLGLQTLDPR
jgi:hypothetical protein